MKPKIICSDIDGTLLNKDRVLSTKTISEIKRNSDIPFILISSRMPAAMTHLQEDLEIMHLPLIAYNGGLIICDGEVISSTEIAHHTSESIYNFCKNSSLHLSFYHKDEWYVPEMDFWAKREANNTQVNPDVQNIDITLQKWSEDNKGAHKIMVMGEAEEIDKLVSYLQQNFKNEVIGYRSKDTYLEIAHVAISKKTAIETLLNHKYPNVSNKEVMAFGDNYNDIEMLKTVGIGVAVANAKAEVLEIADDTTDTNKNDGVANYLEKIFS